MDYSGLLVALLMPWLAGYFWLAVLEHKLNVATPNMLRQIGYGLFLGYAGLQGLVLAYNRLFGSVDFWPILGLVGLIASIGAILWLKTSPSCSNKTVPATVTSAASGAANVLFWLFIAWTGVHLLLVAIEILHRPIFPWDAWLSWMYRAKAWFFTGHIFVLDAPREWLVGSGNAPYNVAGNNYPTLVPVLALWAATALGQWSETLVNLPVLFCGIALGLGVYGQCREYGLQRWLCAMCAYLLLSIPLVDAHLSLAGQADIWMAGFTGLGFVALLHGIIRNNTFQIVLGLGMAAIAIATKEEGFVWFLAALLTLALAKSTAVTAIILLLVASITVLGWLLGFTYVELPLLGGIGYTEGHVHVPLVGIYPLQSFDLWDDYYANFLEGGSWHLLWPFLGLSLIVLWYAPAGIMRRTIIIFYTVVVAVQLMIFEGTVSGRWAEDWTAINRLPLHFAPSLIFCLVVLVPLFLNRHDIKRSLGSALGVPALGLLVTLAGTAVYLLLTFPDSERQALIYSPKDMHIVVGSGYVKDDVGVIESFENNVAVVSSGPVSINTENFDLLRLEAVGSNQKQATFFWRNGKRPEDLHSVDIADHGISWVNLSRLPNWRGTLNEIGIIFYQVDRSVVEFYGAEITPHSMQTSVRKLYSDWSEMSLWTQKSAHWLPAGSIGSDIPLPIIMAIWVFAALLLSAVVSRYTPGASTGALLCAIAAWCLLDLRWTVNSMVQAATTVRDYPMAEAASLDFGDDRVTQGLADMAFSDIDNLGQRTIIMAEDEKMRFKMLRAKYHALPAAVYVHEAPVETVPIDMADHLLVLKKLYYAPGYKPASAVQYAVIIHDTMGIKATPLWDKREGFMLKIARNVKALQHDN